MAYVNVKDWSVDQVTEWLKGLDNVILPYAKSFLNNGVNGYQLLNLRADDLEHLGVATLGHQEIILEAVEHLRNLHYELDKENLQTLALRLSCAANSLYKELLLADDNCTMVQTQVMSDVHNIITTIKPLVCWLDRSPFQGDKDYTDNKTQLLELGFEMATSAHRDIFSEKPNVTIRNICEKLAKMADHIIQEIMDPMILQPASLDLATLKKKEQELGFFIMPNNHAVHQIAEIKYGSPAHGSTKIEEGDEIVQVNYQTVVGWQRKKVLMLLQESPPEIVLTLKKRPRHTKVYGQIYMKPYRLPSKKKSTTPYSRWNENLPSPRLLTIQDLLHLPTLKLPPVSEPQDHESTETNSSSSDNETQDSGVRMYPLKPRPVLQRRNTITGATPTSKRPYPDLQEYWQLFKNSVASAHSSSYNIDSSKFPEDSMFLRDKSVSCSHGLELSPRPTTVIGIAQNRSVSNKTPSFKKEFKEEKSSIKKRVNFEDAKSPRGDQHSPKREEVVVNKETDIDHLGFSAVSNEDKSLSVNSLSSLTENIAFIDEGRDITDRTSMANDWQKEIVEEIIEAINVKPFEKYIINSEKISPNNSTSVVKDAALADVHIQNIIKKFDEQKENAKPKIYPRSNVQKANAPQRPDAHKKPAVPVRSAATKLRGRLDKSHSTPAYDLTQEENAPVEGVLMETKRSVVETKIVKETVVTSYTESKKFEIEVTPIPNTDRPKEELISGEMKTDKSEENLPELSKPMKVTNLQISLITTNITQDDEPKETGLLTKPQFITPKESLPPKPQKIDVESSSKNSEPEIKQKHLLDLSELRSTKPAPKELPQKAKMKDDVPPKPPPRTFAVVDVSKPIPLPETPKLPETPRYSNDQFGHSPKTNFEFPDVKSKLKEAGDGSMKNFEPKVASTPTWKYDKTDVNEPTKTVTEKISPTNSVVRAMIYSNKSKMANKKKNLLIAKRRKVMVSDFPPEDMQGYLHQRLRSKQPQNVHWEKRWFVLSGGCLYGFKNKDSPRASCLIFLSDFTVAVANEVKSRSNAFKVYHTGTVFYFSADNHEMATSWIETITAATLHSDGVKNTDSSLYSETDESDSEKPKSVTSDKPPETVRKFGSLKKFTSKKSSDSSASSGSTSLDRKWFFNKSSVHSKNAVPVPTAQFRSYRKIRTGDVDSGSVSTGNFTSHVPMYASQLEISTISQAQNVSVPNLTIDNLSSISHDAEKNKAKPKKNYLHISNPSLCNVNDYGMPSFNKAKNYPENENLAGFVTLEELMNRQTEERKLNPHHKLEDVSINMNLIRPDVVYGEVPIRPKEKTETARPPKKTHSRAASDSSRAIEKQHHETSSCFGKRLGSIKKSSKEDTYETATYPKSAKGFDSKYNRSLPRMHKLQSEVAQDSTESLKFADRSYEMIYCPQTVTDVQFAQNRTLDDKMYQDTPKKSNRLIRQHSLTSADKKGTKYKHEDPESLLPIFKGAKVGDSSISKVKLKSAMQYTPMALPLAQDPKGKLNPKFAFELNLDEKSSKTGKFKFFSKQSDAKKEKTFLGSPKLHRAIFRKNADSDLSSSTNLQQSISDSSLEVSSSTTINIENLNVVHLSQHPDYPGLEYPPVFEPETYSLADPQSSLTLIRKQTKNSSP